MKDFNIYEYNLTLSKRFGGKIPTYLLPIGHTKEQKHGCNKMKEYLEAQHSNIHKSLDYLKTPLRNKSAVSRFKTSRLDRDNSNNRPKSKTRLAPTTNVSIENTSTSHRSGLPRKV
jgi:hypothetical protein